MTKGTSQEKLYDLSFLENMESADEEFVKTLKGVFINTTPPASRQMVEACNARDWDTAGRIAHKLKSSIDILNISTIKSDIKMIENYAKEKMNVESLPGIAKKVDEVIRLAAEQMQQEL